MSDEVRLRALLGGPDLAWLVERLARRVRQGQALRGRLRLPEADSAQQDALARLTGRYGRGECAAVDLDALERQLQEAGVADSLQEVVEILVGPLEPSASVRAREAAVWELAFTAARDPGWAELRRSGLVRRLAGGDPDLAGALVQQAEAVLSALPGSELAASGLPLQALAARTGDAHALDPGRPLGTLVLRLICARTGLDPADRRLAWAAVGVELDPLSATVLVLGLRARGNGLSARLLDLCAESGEPCRLTLRQLRGGVQLDAPDVFVCENPSVVVAAADTLGERCKPLVCVEGQPGSAAWVVLESAGARVRYHGDLDWPGLRIGAEVLTRTGGRPWRFDASSYADAPKGLELSGAPVDSPWDRTLAEEMARCGRAVHEEAVLDLLLGDLARG